MDYHILIVEDDKDIREGIEIYLKNQGYVVFQAADGVEGLSVIEKEDIHLAIVDVMMPRMDGINMMMRVRELGYEFPVIMLSAKSEEVDKIMGLNMGADDYVPVPADAAAFTLLKEQLMEVLGTLTEREQKVLRLRFGLDDGRARTLEEVGKEFNVTRERIRQIEAKALRKLRHPSRSRKLKDYLD